MLRPDGPQPWGGGGSLCSPPQAAARDVETIIVRKTCCDKLRPDGPRGPKPPPSGGPLVACPRRLRPAPIARARCFIIGISLFLPSLIRTLASPKILPLGNAQINLALPSLIRTLASPKILPLGNAQINFALPSLIRTLASPKILPLGNAQINLALPSLIRIFARKKRGCRSRE